MSNPEDCDEREYVIGIRPDGSPIVHLNGLPFLPVPKRIVIQNGVMQIDQWKFALCAPTRFFLRWYQDRIKMWLYLDPSEENRQWLKAAFEAFNDELLAGMKSKNSTDTMNGPTQLISFYKGIGKDNAGRKISEIHEFPFHKLESSHDFIQWLFPLAVRSAFNPEAPVLTEKDRFEFHNDIQIRANYWVSMDRMLGFFGYRENNKGVIERSPLWKERAAKWFTPENHNVMRVTRILRSCMLCGFIPQALALHEALRFDTQSVSGDWKRPLEFWSDAVSVIPGPPEP